MKTAVVQGTVQTLHRYPVKSMQGEQFHVGLMTARGVFGDRAYALVDVETGKVVSAKNPRKWPGLFAYRASYVAPLNGNGHVPEVRITFPGGATVTSGQAEAGGLLSQALGRSVTIANAVPATVTLEEYWPDLEELPHRDAVTDEAMPPGTFFDCASVHVVTTATLRKLQSLYPGGTFDIARLRPNIVIDCEEEGFVENGWIGETIAIGENVRLRVSGGTPRCVMTTLSQGALPQDTNILKTAAVHNGAHIGVYASVLQGGAISVGDTVGLHANA